VTGSAHMGTLFIPHECEVMSDDAGAVLK
jgi:hypothetical protein